MCLLCIETAKEKIKPFDFWKNYREMEISDEHEKELDKIIGSTSIKYQQELFEAMPPHVKKLEVNYE